MPHGDLPTSPIFVVGCFRSGTTLIEQILRQHPRIGGPGFETLLFTHVVPGRRLPNFNAEQWNRWITEVSDLRGLEAVRDTPLATFEKNVARAISLEKKQRWVEKSPWHLFHVERILQRYPQARFISVVRDGRDVVTSIVHTPYVLPRIRSRLNRLVAACVLWEWMATEGLRLLTSEKLRDSILPLRYEDIVTDTQATLPQLDDFLQLGCDKRARDRWLASLQACDGNSTFGQIRGLSTTPIGRWRDTMKLTPAEAHLVGYLLNPRLRLLGYEPSDEPHLGTTRRAAASALKLAWSLARIASFPRNAGFWPPPHLRLFLRPCLMTPNHV
jgi:hypothetical protein